MASIEERVVGMRFDSSNFQKGIQPALDGLDKLKSSLKLDGATKAIDELDAAGKRFSLGSTLGTAVDGVSGKFIALATIGITALSNIVNKAVNAGEQIVRSLTIDPIKAGLDEYELKMGSIQTILSNTARYGTTLEQVTASLDQLNTYADKTIYNFGDMTKNIGLFTNAGLRIEEATSLIKGFSNEAAASGTNAQGAAGAAYQLSQALSAGTIRLMDWRSLQNVGMGNKNMQRGLIEIAEAMGTFSNGAATAQSATKNFNGSLEENWLTADVMSNYLKIMAGDLTEAEQATLGLSKATIEGFSKQQKMSEEAATKVRTYTQLIGTLREAVGSSWSQSFDIIIGDFNEATELFTDANNALGAIIGQVGDARNKILQDWSDNGGRKAAIDAISSAFRILMKIITVVGNAFNEIFPPATGRDLARLTKQIRDFILSLEPSTDMLHDIKISAKGFFAVLDIGRMIIVEVVKMIASLLGYVGTGGDDFFDFTASIGQFLIKVRDAIKEGKGLTQFFSGLTEVLKVILGVLAAVGAFVVEFFSSLADFGKTGFEGFIDRVGARFEALGNFIGMAKTAVMGFWGVLQAVAAFFAPFVQRVAALTAGFAPAMQKSFNVGSFSPLLDLINTTILGGIGVGIYKFIKLFKSSIDSLTQGGSITDAIKNVFGALTDTLKVLQGQIKASTITLIAVAVALLTASVIGLSLIDPGKLAISLGAITVMFLQMAGAMLVLDKAMGKGLLANPAKLIAIAVAMQALGVAMLIFSASIAILGSLSWDELARGLVGLAGALTIMSAAMFIMSKVGPGAILGSVGLVVASVGMLALAAALKVFATMSWDDIGRGMTVLGASLAIMAVGLTLMAATLPGSAALVIASVGLLLIAGALKVFSTLSWDDIGRSMTTLGGTLAILAVGLTLMAAAIPGAAALVVASVGLAVIAGVLKIFSTMSWDDIGRGMTLLGGTLGILALGLTLMVAALPGAAALLVASAALAVLAPVILALSLLTWDQVAMGLGVLAISLGLIAVAGYALIPAVPGLLGLAGAVALLGVGVLAAGLGIAAFAAGLGVLATVGSAAIIVMTAAITAFAGLIPYLAQQIGLGIIAIAVVISESGPQILAALTTVLLALVQALVEIIPPLVAAATLLITELVKALIILIPLLVDAGLKIVIGILNGIAKNIGKVIEKGVDVIVALLKGIGEAAPRLMKAGAQLIIDYINGLADTIRAKAAAIRAAGLNLAMAIIDGMTGGLATGASKVIQAIIRMATNALNAAKKALGIASPSKEFHEVGEFSAQGLAKGLIDTSKVAEKAAEQLGTNAIDKLKKSMSNAGMYLSLGMEEPTIRPVLDLSQVRKDAGLIGGIVGGQSLSVDGAAARANEISEKYGEYQQAVADAQGPTTEVNLTQNNYSPKALSQAEIYRQGKNQISILKGELEKKDA